MAWEEVWKRGSQYGTTTMKPSTESHLKLRIADRHFDLILVPDRNRDDGAASSAASSEWYQKIYLSVERRRADGIMSDLWHEVVEQISCTYNLGLSHQTICTIATSVHQVIRDNPKVLLEIAKKGDHK